MSNPFDIFDGSRKYESELKLIVSLLAHPSPGLLLYPFSVVGMDRLHRSFAARRPVMRIKPENSISLIRPIENRCVVEDRGAGVTQPLCFRQIGFAATKQVFGVPGLIDVDGQTVPLDNASLSIT